MIRSVSLAYLVSPSSGPMRDPVSVQGGWHLRLPSDPPPPPYPHKRISSYPSDGYSSPISPTFAVCSLTGCLPRLFAFTLFTFWSVLSQETTWLTAGERDVLGNISSITGLTRCLRVYRPHPCPLMLVWILASHPGYRADAQRKSGCVSV